MTAQVGVVKVEFSGVCQHVKNLGFRDEVMRF